jgi:hypothetical protein
MAERDAAIHAAGRLLSDGGGRQGLDEFLPGAQAILHRIIGAVLALDLQETGGLAHL